MEPAPLILLLAGELRMRGGTAYTLRLARNLPEHGYRVRTISENLQFLSRDYVRQFSMSEVTHLSTPFLNRVVLKLLLAELRQNPPAIIHVQSRQMLPPGVRLARELSVPLVLTVHDYLGDRETLRVPQPLVRQIIAVSDSVRNDLLERTQLPPEIVKVIRSGVEQIDDWECTGVFVPGRIPVFGSAGVLESVKGLHFLLGAAQIVLRTLPQAQFLISGTGPEESRLHALARELGIQHQVTFMTSPHDFSEALSAMDVFCLPSLKQGLGTIMLEAMARGRPVIATKTGGVYSIVKDRESGLVVPPGDTRALAEKMIELARSPDWARELGQHGRQLVQKEYSVARMLEETVGVYRQLLQTHPVPVSAKS
jgi:glycosyltransferase involved in cell wall biosynthesis